jgi:hypothetical protein
MNTTQTQSETTSNQTKFGTVKVYFAKRKEAIQRSYNGKCRADGPAPAGKIGNWTAHVAKVSLHETEKEVLDRIFGSK